MPYSTDGRVYQAVITHCSKEYTYALARISIQKEYRHIQSREARALSMMMVKQETLLHLLLNKQDCQSS